MTATGDLAAGASETVKLTGKVQDPRLWSRAIPTCTRVVLTLKAGGETADTCEVPFGIRSVRWTLDQGFFINGHQPEASRGWGQKSTDEWPGTLPSPTGCTTSR